MQWGEPERWNDRPALAYGHPPWSGSDSAATGWAAPGGASHGGRLPTAAGAAPPGQRQSCTTVGA